MNPAAELDRLVERRAQFLVAVERHEAADFEGDEDAYEAAKVARRQAWEALTDEERDLVRQLGVAAARRRWT